MTDVPISVSVNIDGWVGSVQVVGDPHDSDLALSLAQSVVKVLLGHGGEQPQGVRLGLMMGPDVDGLMR